MKNSLLTWSRRILCCTGILLLSAACTERKPVSESAGSDIADKIFHPAKDPDAKPGLEHGGEDSPVKEEKNYPGGTTDNDTFASFKNLWSEQSSGDKRASENEVLANQQDTNAASRNSAPTTSTSVSTTIVGRAPIRQVYVYIPNNGAGWRPGDLAGQRAGDSAVNSD